jgi:hypothetical protein
MSWATTTKVIADKQEEQEQKQFDYRVIEWKKHFLNGLPVARSFYHFAVAVNFRWKIKFKFVGWDHY